MLPSGKNHQIIDYVPYFEELIDIQKGAIISFKRWAGGFAVIGSLTIALGLILSVSIPGASQIMGIGGGFIGALAVFPYKEIAPRRSRISTYVLLKRGFEKYHDLPEEERKRLSDLADETIKKQI